MSYDDWACNFEKDATLLIILLTLLILTAGCGFHYTYNKPGVSQQQRAQDDYQCKQESRGYSYLSTGSAAAGGDSLNWELYKSCQEARGYTVEIKD